MNFAKKLFFFSGIWGFLALIPSYFLEARVGHDYPPAITHPEYYYGFAGVALAWQVAFFVIAKDPIRFKPIIIPGTLEKLGYGLATLTLVALHRAHPSNLIFAGVDLVLASLFMLAYAKLPS